MRASTDGAWRCADFATRGSEITWEDEGIGREEEDERERGRMDSQQRGRIRRGRCGMHTAWQRVVG